MFKKLFLGLLAAWSLKTQAQVVDERDVVSWTTAIVTVRCDSAPHSFQVFSQARLTQNASRFQSMVFAAFALRRVFSSASIGLGFTLQSPVNDRLLTIVALQLGYEGRWGNAPHSLRFRAERLTWRSQEDFFVEIISDWRFRFRPEIIVPIWKNYGLLIGNEFFFNVRDPILNQNRAQIGIRFRQADVAIDALYQHRFINRVAGLPDRIEHTLLLNFIFAVRV